MLEYMESDLQKYLKRFHPLSAEQIRSVGFQLLLGVAFLHANRVLHRDLKPQHVLVTGSTVKITDFGSAQLEAF